MSDVKDLTSQMAKELAQGIKDNVEDIATAFKKMAIINPNRNQKVMEVKQEAASAPRPGVCCFRSPRTLALGP